METVQWNVGRYVAVRRMDGVSTIFDSIRAVHPELSGHALVAQARVLNAAHSSSRMIFPHKMPFRSLLAFLSLALALGFSFSSPASAAAWTQPEYLYRYFVCGAQFAFSSRAGSMIHTTISSAPGTRPAPI